MVSKIVCFFTVIIAIIFVTATAKPSGHVENEFRAFTADDALVDPQIPPRLRINRHGRRGFVNSQDSYPEPALGGDKEYVEYDTRGMDFEDKREKENPGNEGGQVGGNTRNEA
ncbi:unnamed protein product [Porites lobata]|uniref:Hymenoptaecin n=1 Tax=Porites lobata TaxID=104759 RepID=A0ABN8NC18_9CNID|nr:unnamed protein product [Porites lobata]